MRVLLMASLIATAAPTWAADSCGDITGKWTTNMGATVQFALVDAQTGQISGEYTPASMPNRQFPLTGFYNPVADGPVDKRHYAAPVSFAVSFQEFGGITHWSGTCALKDGKAVIETEDLIIAPVADYDWSHVIDNHDTLVRQKP